MYYVNPYESQPEVARRTTAVCRREYDVWSESYDADDNPMISMATMALVPLMHGLCNARVVEFGCGTGRVLANLQPFQVAELVGVDASSGMLAKAKQQKLNAPTVLIRGDIGESLPLESHIADLCLFVLVLEHVADIASALREAARLLRPGGRIVIAEMHPDLHAAGAYAHFKDASGEIHHLPSYSHTLEEFREVGKASGLEIESWEDCRPTAAMVASQPKLAKRGDLPLLLRVTMVKKEL